MPKTNNTNDVGEALALLSATQTDEEARIRDEGADAMKAGKRNRPDEERLQPQHLGNFTKGPQVAGGVRCKDLLIKKQQDGISKIL